MSEDDHGNNSKKIMKWLYHEASRDEDELPRVPSGFETDVLRTAARIIERRYKL